MDRNTHSLVLVALCAGCIILGFNVWTLKNANTSLENDKIEFAMQTSAKSREVGTKEEVINQLKNELKSQTDLNAKTQKEKQALGDKVKWMESATKKKAAEISTLNKNVEQLKNEKKKLGDSLSQLMEQIETLEEEINNKNIEIENMKNDTIAKESEIENLRNDIESKVHEHENLKNEIVSKLNPPTEVKIENEDTLDKEGATEDGEAGFAATMDQATAVPEENGSSFYSYNDSASSYSSAVNN